MWCFLLNDGGVRCVGQLCVNFLVSGSEWSVIEHWTHIPSLMQPDFLHRYALEFEAVKVPTENIVASLTFRPPDTDSGSRVGVVIIPDGV